MWGISHSPVQQRLLPYREFFLALIRALENEGLRLCVLRNHRGFPDKNTGNDIDCIILRSDLPRAIHALESIHCVRIVGYIERYYAASIFLEGVDSAGDRSVQIDFHVSLSYKGLPFLFVETVLQSAISHSVDGLTFFTLSPVHEAIISLFHGLLLGGVLKEKFFLEIQRTFSSEKSAVIAALSTQFGLRVATELVDAVIEGNRLKILGIAAPLRRSLALRCGLSRPVSSLDTVLKHCLREFADRFLPQTMENVSIVGLSAASRKIIIEDLLANLRFSAKILESGLFDPASSLQSSRRAESDDRGVLPRLRLGHPVAIIEIVKWLLREWHAQFKNKKNLTLRIGDIPYDEPFMDSRKSVFAYSAWLVRIVARLSPRPDLLILLKGPIVGGMLSPSSLGGIRESAIYPHVAKRAKQCFTLGYREHPDQVADAAYAAIIDALVQQTSKRLAKRFP